MMDEKAFFSELSIKRNGGELTLTLSDCTEEGERFLRALLQASEQTPSDAPVMEEPRESTIEEDVCPNEDDLPGRDLSVMELALSGLEEHDVIFSFKKYHHQSAAKLLLETKDKGFCILCYLYDLETVFTVLEERYAIDAMLSSYKEAWFSSILSPKKYANEATEDICNEFFDYFKYVISDSDKKKIAAQAKFESFNSFRLKAPLWKKQAALFALIEKNKTK